ncbi:hypothetical protein M3Y99_01995300 [Aphelenchoides fujianensis]|nr:hypothetical protein M3Y99_01995300 [Aphelenchoides fujianensis]
MDASGLAAATAEEVLSGIRTVATFNAQPLELRRYSLHLNEAYRYGIRKASLSLVLHGRLRAHQLLFYGCRCLDGLQPGDQWSDHARNCFLGLLGGHLWHDPVGQSDPYLSVIMKARIAAAELFEIIDRKPALDFGEP